MLSFLIKKLQQPTEQKSEIILDSICNNRRITTFKLKVWKPLLAEINTHRALSKSAGSSRAIPLKKMRQSASFMPQTWGKKTAGMQSKEELTGFKLLLAMIVWRLARSTAKFYHYLFDFIGLHKQIANRILEPYLYVDQIITATEFKNFFLLRNHPDAQPELGYLAKKMQDNYVVSIPKTLNPGEWHIPLTKDIEYDDLNTKLKVSASRCARTSYNSFTTGKNSTQEEDLSLFSKLACSQPKHLSPLEHQAVATEDPNERHANFVGWLQHRKWRYQDSESGGDYKS